MGFQIEDEQVHEVIFSRKLKKVPYPGVPQGSILDPCYLSDGSCSNPKLFADHTSLFSMTHDTDTSAVNQGLFQTLGHGCVF